MPSPLTAHKANVSPEGQTNVILAPGVLPAVAAVVKDEGAGGDADG